MIKELRCSGTDCSSGELEPQTVGLWNSAHKSARVHNAPSVKCRYVHMTMYQESLYVVSAVHNVLHFNVFVRRTYPDITSTL